MQVLWTVITVVVALSAVFAIVFAGAGLERIARVAASVSIAAFSTTGKYYNSYYWYIDFFG